MTDFNHSISLVGYGNVGWHLLRAFIDRGINVSHFFSRSNVNDPFFIDHSIEIVHQLSDLPEHQLTIICVPDDQIEPLISTIPESIPVAYTSGSVQLSRFSANRKNVGVFYPLQTFTREVELNVFEIPFFIEGDSSVFAQQLFDLAWKISRKVEFADSQKRSQLHLAAVWVNNFTNHVNVIAKEYLDQHELDFGHLLPLLEETVNKLKRVEPKDAQTGPAIRRDASIIQSHLDQLQGDQRAIYELLTNNIQDTHKQ